MFKLSKWAIVIIAIIIFATFSIAIFSQYFVHKKADLSRVACLGDSNTEISGYPEYLQMLLGEEYVVRNFGISGVAVNLQSSNPYCDELNFQDVKDFDPTTVILMIGTNDVRTDNCLKIDSFTDDYQYLISQIQSQTKASALFIVIPPPVFDNLMELNGPFLADEIIPRIQQIAAEKNLPLIDLYTPMLNHPECFPDGIHPDKVGTQIITQIIYDAIKDVS